MILFVNLDCLLLLEVVRGQYGLLGSLVHLDGLGELRLASLDCQQLFDYLDILLGNLLILGLCLQCFCLGLPGLVILADGYGSLTGAVGECGVDKRSQAILSY